MKRKINMSILFFIITFLIQGLHALQVGSNTSPSRQGLVTFPAGATDNVMIGYASFENGFRLADNGTTCSFDSLMHVSGEVDMNGGKLYLMEDLYFSDTTEIKTLGSIYGNEKTVHFSPSITELKSKSSEFMLIISSYYMGARVNSVDYSSTLSYALAATENNGSGPEVRLLHYNNFDLTLTASSELGRDVNSVHWQPGHDNFVIATDLLFGPEINTYAYELSSGNLSTISSLTMSSIRDFSAARISHDGNYLVVGMRMSTGFFTSNELWWHEIRPTGELIDLGSQSFPGAARDPSDNALSWSPGGNYFAVGTEPSAGAADLMIYSFDGFNITATIEMETGLTVRAVDWQPTGSLIAVAFVGSTTQNVLLFEHNISNGSLTPQSSAYINQDTDVLSLRWSSDGLQLGIGTALSSGVGAFRKYDLDPTLTTLSLTKSFSFASDVRTVAAIPFTDNFVMGAGDSVFILADEYPAGYTLTMDNITFNLANDITLKAPIGITNQCYIIGNNHTFNFDELGTIVVKENASLSLKNMTLKNFGSNQLKCFDDSATITLDNVKFIFKEPYFFNNGKFDIYNTFEVSGTYSFVYATPMVTTIFPHSQWLFDSFSTLSYAPLSNNRKGIQLTDKSSKLIFNNATLYSTATGLALTKGELVILGNVSIESDAALTVEGIEWGDGISSDSDMLVTIMPGSRVTLESGYLCNKNIT